MATLTRVAAWVLLVCALLTAAALDMGRAVTTDALTLAFRQDGLCQPYLFDTARTLLRRYPLPLAMAPPDVIVEGGRLATGVPSPDGTWHAYSTPDGAMVLRGPNGAEQHYFDYKHGGVMHTAWAPNNRAFGMTARNNRVGDYTVELVLLYTPSSEPVVYSEQVLNLQSAVYAWDWAPDSTRIALITHYPAYANAGPLLIVASLDGSTRRTYAVPDLCPHVLAYHPTGARP